MKKRKNFDEFLGQLEKAIDNIIDEIDVPDDRPVNIEISLYLCPRMFFGSGAAVRQIGKTPVDILETEKNIHAVIRIPEMEMETVKLEDSGRVVEITAPSGGDSINEMIELPARVNKGGMMMTYKNGILELVFNKRRTGKRSEAQRERS